MSSSRPATPTKTPPAARREPLRAARSALRAGCIAAGLTLAALAPSGCASTPEEPPAVRFDPQWWQGVWVVDTAALVTTTAREGLSPGAQSTAAALLTGLEGAVRYELAGQRLRVIVAGEATELRIVSAEAEAQAVSLRLSDGREATLRRVDARETTRATWVDARGELPLTRPDDG